MPTIKSNFITGDAWVEAYTLSSLSAGLGLTIQNTGVHYLRYSINTPTPLVSEKHLYPSLSPFEKINLPHGTISVYLIGAEEVGTYVNINKANVEFNVSQDKLESDTKNGYQYVVAQAFPSIASGASAYIGVTTGPSPIVIRNRAILQLGSDILTYRAAEGSAFTGGTPIIPLNQNRNSSRTATTTFVHTPSDITEGTIYLPKQYLLSSGTNAASRTGSDLANIFTILKPNTKHIFTIQNEGSTAAAPVSWKLTIYENSFLDLPL